MGDPVKTIEEKAEALWTWLGRDDGEFGATRLTQPIRSAIRACKAAGLMARKTMLHEMRREAEMQLGSVRVQLRPEGWQGVDAHFGPLKGKERRAAEADKKRLETFLVELAGAEFKTNLALKELERRE
jgi:hypothetical protein